MAQLPAYYKGADVTCYPSSNAKDDGKLNMEFNMARLVTRVSSKNFCIVNPSFTIQSDTDSETGDPILTISAGQCSINGMDLIMVNPISISAPETNGSYYLGFKLYRDSKGNVLGDFERGVDTIFQGIYLDYYSQKDETDPDMLWLGSLDWDGTSFSNIEEDEDKYGRIWAHDILCKIIDPKHPTVSRLLLQDWLYNVPDWYFSKEGDIIYGALEMTDGREGSGEVGIKMQCATSTNSELLIKAPTTLNSDLNKIGKFTATDEIVQLSLGNTILKVDSTNNDEFTLLSPDNVTLKSNSVLNIKGSTEVNIGSGGLANGPLLTIKDHKATLTDTNINTLKDETYFVDANTIQHTFGEAIWQYTNNIVSLLTTNVNQLNIKPSTLFDNNVDIANAGKLILRGDTGTDTYLDNQILYFKDSNNNTMQLTTLGLTSNNLATTNINLVKGSASSNLSSEGSLILTGTSSVQPLITFTQGSASTATTLSHTLNTKGLTLDGALSLTSLSASSLVQGNGLQTNNGILTFVNGNNNATISKENNSSTLATSSTLKVGATGTEALQAGNTTISGNLSVTGNYTTANGNITATNGTITGNRVIGSVYQDIAESYEKDKDEVIEEGDLVYITTKGKVSKPKTIADCSRVIGICSEHAGLELGSQLYSEEVRCMVGILGKLYVKTEQDFLKCGDCVKAAPEGVRKVTNVLKDLQFIVGTVIEPYKDGKVRINFRKGI